MNRVDTYTVCRQWTVMLAQDRPDRPFAVAISDNRRNDQRYSGTLRQITARNC